jgi:hypothetical protein
MPMSRANRIADVDERRKSTDRGESQKIPSAMPIGQSLYIHHASTVTRRYRNKMKRMDFVAWQGARRSHGGHYGDDEQRRHAAKDAGSCCEISVSRS